VGRRGLVAGTIHSRGVRQYHRRESVEECRQGLAEGPVTVKFVGVANCLSRMHTALSPQRSPGPS
jgi:hypothetical protein